MLLILLLLFFGIYYFNQLSFINCIVALAGAGSSFRWNREMDECSRHPCVILLETIVNHEKLAEPMKMLFRTKLGGPKKLY